MSSKAQEATGSALEAMAERMAVELAGPCEVPEGMPIIAACSGGADSCALVAGLTLLTNRWPLKAVVFVDHGLRDVRKEELAAGKMAERAGLSLTVRRCTLRVTGNLQSEARIARYRHLHEIAGDGAVVATGHTMTDQAETVLQRVTRGAGLRGLAGIRAREGAVIRPMLQIKREETRSLGLPFIDDPTNALDTYQRNRIRHHVLPQLRLENPKADEAIALMAKQAQGEIALIDAVLEQIHHDSVPLDGLDTDTLTHWLRWRLGTEGVASRPPSRAAVSALATRVVAGLRQGRFSLGGGVQAHLRNGALRFETMRDPRASLVVNGPGTYGFRNHLLHVETRENSPTRSERACNSIWERIVAAHALSWPITIHALQPDTSLQRDHENDVLIGLDGSRWSLQDGAGRSLLNGPDNKFGGVDCIHLRLVLASTNEE